MKVLYLFIVIVFSFCRILAQKESKNQYKQGNTEIIIDGTLSESEWKNAKKLELAGGGEAIYKVIEDVVYMGVRGVEEGWVTIYLTDGKNIYALHASAALGTAIYKKEKIGWKNIQGFNYQVRDASMSEEAIKLRESFYKKNHWVASTVEMSNKNEREFKISKKFSNGKKMKIAIVYATATDPIKLQICPKTLSDDTTNLELVKGNTPPELKFNFADWTIIEF